jgi:DNA processing protein
MMWDQPKNHAPNAIQRPLFIDLNDEESCIVKILDKYGEGIHINTLVVEAKMPVNRLSAILFELELRGIVRPSGGNTYKLIR